MRAATVARRQRARRYSRSSPRSQGLPAQRRRGSRRIAGQREAPLIDDGVFLLFNMGGPAAVRIAPLAMNRRVPYMFPHTALLTQDADRYVFTSFPRFAGETACFLMS